MTNFTARFAGIATLALAAVPVVALSTAAYAAPTPAHVRVADLDLRSRAGQATFDRRVARVADDMCRGQRVLPAKSACEQAVRDEAREKVSQIAAR